MLLACDPSHRFPPGQSAWPAALSIDGRWYWLDLTTVRNPVWTYRSEEEQHAVS